MQLINYSLLTCCTAACILYDERLALAPLEGLVVITQLAREVLRLSHRLQRPLPISITGVASHTSPHGKRRDSTVTAWWSRVTVADLMVLQVCLSCLLWGVKGAEVVEAAG